MDFIGERTRDTGASSGTLEEHLETFSDPDLSAVPRISFLSRALPPDVTGQMAKQFHTVIEWAPASIIARKRALKLASRSRTRSGWTPKQPGVSFSSQATYTKGKAFSK